MPAPPRPLIPLWSRFLTHFRRRFPLFSASFIVPSLDSYGISGGEPKALAHHPLAREQITSSLLNNDDNDLWLLTRLIRSIEWELLLCNYPTATAMMQNLIIRLPALISSPSYHYLWARMLSQQGYLDRAAFHRKKALECFLPYTMEWLRVSEESVVLKLLMELIWMRGDEGAEPSEEFLMMLGQGYDGFVRMRHPRDVTFFHCDLFHLYLEYQYLILEETIRPDIIFSQNTHAIAVVGHQIQHGNFFSCHTLYRWILKNLGIRFTLESVIEQFKNIFQTHTPCVVLVEKMMGEMYFSAAKNALHAAAGGDGEEQVTRHVIDHVWDLYQTAITHAYNAGDELLITDINWMIFLLDYNVNIFQNVRSQRNKNKGKHAMVWYNFEIMFDDFSNFWKFYASRDDAARIGIILDQFDPTLQLCRSLTLVNILDPAWAYYHMVTGDKRGEHPFWTLSNLAFRKLDIINVLKAIDTHEELYPERSCGDEYDMMEYKLFAYQRLGGLYEGIPLGINLVQHCQMFDDNEHVGMAMYDYLLFKATLAHTVIPGKRGVYVSKLKQEFESAIAWDGDHLPISDLHYKMGAMLAMFHADNWRYLKSNNDGNNKGQGLQEVYSSIEILTKWHSTWKVKRHMTKQTRYQLEFYLCISKYLAGYTEEAFIHALKIAGTLTPLPGLRVENYRGETQYEKQNIQLWMDWMLFFIAAYVDVIENVSFAGRSVRADLVDRMDHEQFWRIAEGLEHYCSDLWELNKLAITYYYLGMFMEFDEKLEDALGYYDSSVELLKEARLYGILGVRRNHLVPEFMRSLKPETVLERAMGLELVVYRKRRDVRMWTIVRRERHAEGVKRVLGKWKRLKERKEREKVERRRRMVERVERLFRLKKKKKEEEEEEEEKYENAVVEVEDSESVVGEGLPPPLNPFKDGEIYEDEEAYEDDEKNWEDDEDENWEDDDGEGWQVDDEKSQAFNSGKGPEYKNENGPEYQNNNNDNHGKPFVYEKSWDRKAGIKLKEIVIPDIYGSEPSSSSSDDDDDENKENIDPNSRRSRRRSRKNKKGKKKPQTKQIEIEEPKYTQDELKRRAEIREGKKPMTGGRAGRLQDTPLHKEPPKWPAPTKDAVLPEHVDTSEHLKVPKPPGRPRKKYRVQKTAKKTRAPRLPHEAVLDSETSDGLWELVQELKSWEYRHLLGMGTLWDDQESLLNELNKLLAYSNPPLSPGQTAWIREIERILRPGGGHGDWSMDWDFLRRQVKENECLKTALSNLLDGDPRLAAPISIVTATADVIEDIYELRDYRSFEQNMIFVDYVAVHEDVYMVYNVEKFRPVKYAPQPICITDHIRLNITKNAIEAWTEDLLYHGLQGNNIDKIMELGSALVQPLRKIARRGDLVVIGNSPLTRRIPFHAIPIGQKAEGGRAVGFDGESEISEIGRCFGFDGAGSDGGYGKEEAENDGVKDNAAGDGEEWVSGLESMEDLPLPEITLEESHDHYVFLANWVDIVYSHSLSVTKQCIHRLDKFENRPKIPTGMNRACFCAVPAEGTGMAAQKATRHMLKKLTDHFGGDRLSVWNTPTGLSKTELRQQAMRTFDFLHFQGEISMQPEGDKPENTAIRIGEETTLSAKDISRCLQFQLGYSPLVTCFGEQPDHLSPDAHLSEVPDGIAPAFLQSGASSVITTIWPVPSYIANRFTEIFYSNFLKRGRLDGDQVWNIAQEVRIAASVVRKEYGRKNSHWASFVLNGAWMRGFRPGGRVKVEKGRNVKSDFVDYQESEARVYPPPEFGLGVAI
ncbi:hypothetical protein TWF730_001927 [Orbilia blumenaviensis]|uniref:CHAT domain-containing protein n=1 Tax=Orbilia blumenaviensis TaxID=1796055 RepID=A0AAV9UHE6_9PEZI